MASSLFDVNSTPMRPSVRWRTSQSAENISAGMISLNVSATLVPGRNSTDAPMADTSRTRAATSPWFGVRTIAA